MTRNLRLTSATLGVAGGAMVLGGLGLTWFAFVITGDPSPATRITAETTGWDGGPGILLAILAVTAAILALFGHRKAHWAMIASAVAVAALLAGVYFSSSDRYEFHVSIAGPMTDASYDFVGQAFDAGGSGGTNPVWLMESVQGTGKTLTGGPSGGFVVELIGAALILCGGSVGLLSDRRGRAAAVLQPSEQRGADAPLDRRSLRSGGATGLR
jgi:hypothetical protein